MANACSACRRGHTHVADSLAPHSTHTKHSRQGLCDTQETVDPITPGQAQRTTGCTNAGCRCIRSAQPDFHSRPRSQQHVANCTGHLPQPCRCPLHSARHAWQEQIQSGATMSDQFEHSVAGHGRTCTQNPSPGHSAKSKCWSADPTVRTALLTGHALGGQGWPVHLEGASLPCAWSPLTGHHAAARSPIQQN